MKSSPLVLLLVAAIGCAPGMNPASQSAESGDNSGERQTVATPEKQAAKPDAAAIKKQMTHAQLELGEPIVNSVGIILIPIPAGQFQMGSSDSFTNSSRREKPQHLVKITKPFYLSAFEVTQEQYVKVMGSRPWQDKEDVQEGQPDAPAMYVSWNDAIEFCRELSAQEDAEYRLPTEAEWEYACRAGTTTAYYFGDDKNDYRPNSPNPWGLFDMHGKVWEWCHDWYADFGHEKVVTNPTGPAQGEGRLIRGGAFGHEPSRSANRLFIEPSDRNIHHGFRPVKSYKLTP